MYPTAIKTIAAAALLLAAATASAQTILYVDADGTAAGGGNGSSWAQAYNNAHPLGLGSGLEAALRHTRDNPGAYELWVAEGTYLPTRQIGPPVRSKTFQIGPNVHLYGGFAGNETSRGQRAPQVHRTVLSGDIGVANVHTDNSMHVVTFNLNNNELATLDGFEVRLGRSETFTGAGMIVSRGSPAFVDCRFVDNLAVYGGAVYIYNVNSAALTRPTFTRCTFSANQATGTQTGGPFPNNLGGAVCVHATNATLGLRVEFTECSFDGNTAQYGGGIGNSGGILLVDRCRFVGNTGVVAGAGINNRPGEVTIIGGAFLGGTGGHGAGVTTLTGLSPGPLSLVCYDTLFLGNQVTGDGGAILAHVSNFKLVNCLLEKNSAVTGGAISISGNGVNELLGCTTHGNQASSQGGGIFYNQAAGGTLTAANSIFWGNTALIGTTEGRQFHTGGVVSGVSVTNSCIQGLATNFGTGNIGNDAAAHDPRFLDPDGADNVAGNEDDDLRIPINSPCANSGNNSRIPPDALDFDRDGNTSEGVPFDLKRDPRINTAVSPTVDMGAYEYHPDQDNDFVSDLRDNCVATANRDQADADADGFGNACDPTIESLSPGAGAAGMTVTVNGSGFILWNANPPQVFFGASPSPSVTYQSPGVLQARVPAGTGVVDVRVRNGNGAEAIRTAFFTYTDLSVVVGQKVPVPAAGYTPVRLSGPVWKDPAGDAFALFAVDDRKAIEIRWTNGADTFVAQYAVSYPASFAPEHVIDITSGLGGAIPAGATDLEVFNEKEWNPGSGFPAEPLNENDELGVIFYAQGSSTLRVFALRVLEASPQYVLLKHRSGGQLRFQVYRVLPGGAFSSSRQLAAARKVGDRLEPFYPLNELIARTSPALVTPDDTKFQTINWARYWLNPEQTTQVFAVNAHPDADPAAGAPVHSFLTIEWPRILTKRDAFSNWVPDPQPQAGSFPYLHRFELYWEKDLSSTQERTITLSAGQGAPLPAGWNYHWQFDAVRGRWTVSDVEVFEIGRAHV